MPGSAPMMKADGSPEIHPRHVVGVPRSSLAASD
jgi:hypothetical protein